MFVDDGGQRHSTAHPCARCVARRRLSTEQPQAAPAEPRFDRPTKKRCEFSLRAAIFLQLVGNRVTTPSRQDHQSTPNLQKPMDPSINPHTGMPWQYPLPHTWGTNPMQGQMAQVGGDQQFSNQTQPGSGEAARNRRPVASDIASPAGQVPRYQHTQQPQQWGYAPPSLYAPPQAQQQLFSGRVDPMYQALQMPAGLYSSNASPAHHASSYATSDQVRMHLGEGLMGERITCTPGHQAFRPACTLIA